MQDSAPTTPQNVNVVNTPTVNVGTMPNLIIGTLPAVSLSGTPNVNIAGSSALLPVQDLTSTAARNVNLVTNTTFGGGLALLYVAPQGTATMNTANGAPYTVPAGQTPVITDITITQVNPGAGINHIVLGSSAFGAAPATLEDFKVSNGSSSPISYHTGIAVRGGSTGGVRLLVGNGIVGPTYPLFTDGTPSAGGVYVFVNGYLTSN